MRYLHSLAMALPLAAAMLFAQDSSQTPKSKSKSESSRTSGQADVGSANTYKGTIVDANCSQASSLMSSSTSENKAKTSAKRDVLRHCQPTSTTTSFAIMTDDGSFYKLDETGNSKVTSEGLNKKNMKASVSGSVDGDTLKVQSLSKM